MRTGLFIRGGRDDWGCYRRFPIACRHTAYEWASALADCHPYPSFMEMARYNLRAQTVAGMKNRELAITDWPKLANAIYRELRTEFDANRLDPLRREYCEDRDDVLDFTRCVFGLDQVLALVRRRGDRGKLIGKLLAREAVAAPTAEMAQDVGVASSEAPAVPKEQGAAAAKPRKRRRDEKWPEMFKALDVLVGTEDWEGAPMKVRLRLVEEQLNKPIGGWATASTLKRAIKDRDNRA